MKRILKRLKRLFCRHDWEQKAVFQDVDPVHNVRYGIRRYACSRCGKVSYQDGRHDRIALKQFQKNWKGGHDT